MTTEEIALSDEKLRAMLAGCEGVTPGPWEADFLEILHVDRRAGGWRKMATVADDEAASDFPVATAAHIAACDPGTIRSLVTELLALRDAVKPFAGFAADNVGADGWDGSGCQKDRIVDWFGPSQFRAIALALSHNPEPMK